MKILSLALLAAALLSCVSCSSEQTLVAGVDVNQVPLSYRGDQNSLTGFEIDLATAVAKRAGMTVRFVPVSWNEKEQALRNNRVNSLWGVIPEGSEKGGDMLLTSPYMSDSQVLITMSSSGITKKEDLSGKSVGAIKGSSAAKVLEKDAITAKLEDGALQYYDDFSTMFLAMQSSQIDAIAADESMAEYFIAQNNTLDYKILPKALSGEKYSVAVRRNDSRLRNAIQNALKSLSADGTSARLSQKWFGKDITLK